MAMKDVWNELVVEGNKTKDFEDDIVKGGVKFLK